MAFLNSDQPSENPVSWLRQKPPFRYVDDVISLTSDHAVGSLLLIETADRYIGSDRLARLLFIEAVAQLAGIHVHNRVGPGYRGYLVGIETATFFPTIHRASPVTLVVDPLAETGNVLRYEGAVRQGDTVLCRAVIRTYLQSGPATLGGAERQTIGNKAKVDNTDTPTLFRYFSGDEPYFAGHFPGDPLVPGVVLVDGMVEAGRKLIGSPGQNAMVFDGPDLVGIEGARFNALVRPGNGIGFKARLIENSASFLTLKCSAFLDRTRCAVATLRFRSP